MTTLPVKLCLASNAYTAQERIDLFIALIRSWITRNGAKGHIPYVWGGTSIVHYTQKAAVPHQKKGITRMLRWYDTAEQSVSHKMGCDCSGLIFRAAQICGIPYFFKNSYTTTCYIPPLGMYDTLRAGDIIWVPGHVMIVADVTHNTLFEQRSYDHGYGKLHEIPLKKVFQGITTYQELVHAYHTKAPLWRIDSSGVVRDKFESWKILPLARVWDLTY